MESSHSAMDLDGDPRLARKRVPRACDQCRRRKSRCDGLANCSACRAVGLACSYGQTAKQIRGPSYVAHLERTVEELQSETRRLSAIQPSGSSRQSPGSISPSSPDVLTSTSDERIPNVPSLSHSNTPSSRSRTTDQANAYVDIIAREPRAKPYGVDVLRQLCNFCYDLPRPGGSHRQDSAMKLVHALDAPFPRDCHYPGGPTSSPPLPPDNDMFIWIELAFSEAFPLWNFVDRGYIESVIQRMWSTTGFGHDENDRDDLALLYAVLAVGQRFEVGENGASERRMQGLAYFVAARDAVPLSSCERSIPALQTVLCMALYVAAASSLTRFHAYVSSAASAALRLGLHEHVSGYPQEEQALRRRVWLAVQAMDVYAASALGLPGSPSSVEMQTESFGSILPGIDEGTMASAAHHQLTGVVHRCIERTYRRRDVQAASNLQPLVISTRALRESSEELDTWGLNCAFITEQLGALTHSVRDGGATSPLRLTECTRIQLLLCYAHCGAQLLLYTPLVHHLAQPSTDRFSDAYLYGARCVRAALATVHIAEELQRRFQLNEAYFQAVDVLLNAILVLLTVQLGSSDGELLREAISAGRLAKDVLLNLSPLSVKATECWDALAPLFQTGKSGAPPKGQSSTKRKANVAEIRDSFRNSYNAHYASPVDQGGIDPMHLWTNEPMIAADDDLPNG